MPEEKEHCQICHDLISVKIYGSYWSFIKVANNIVCRKCMRGHGIEWIVSHIFEIPERYGFRKALEKKLCEVIMEMPYNDKFDYLKRYRLLEAPYRKARIIAKKLRPRNETKSKLKIKLLEPGRRNRADRRERLSA